MPPDDGLRRSQAENEQGEVTKNRALLAQLKRSGASVTFIAKSDRTKRVMEELLPDAITALAEVMKCAKGLGVSREDMFIGELPNGFVIEIPRIRRKIAVQGQTIAILTSTHGLSSCFEDEGRWRSFLRQAMLREIIDVQKGGSFHSVPGERTIVGNAVDMNKYRESHEHREWYLARLSARTEKERELDAQRQAQEITQVISKVRELTVRQLLTQEGIVVEGYDLGEIGSIVGIRGFRDNRADRAILAAKIHGEDHPEVRAAFRSLRQMA